MKKKSPKETEKDNLLSKKNNADHKWDVILDKLQKGETVSFSVIAQSMSECNLVDYALMHRNLLN